MRNDTLDKSKNIVFKNEISIDEEDFDEKDFFLKIMLKL